MPRRKAVSTVRSLARTCLAVLKDKNPVFRCDDTFACAAVDHQTRSVGSHTIQREKRPCDKTRGQKYRKEILPLGEQVLARRPGANVSQLLQPRVTGLGYSVMSIWLAQQLES